MQTLKQLNNDELTGIKKLTLSENLITFPEKIFDLCDSLEILDLSNNKFTKLPNLEKLTHLKIAFFSNNLFKEVPDAFKGCKNLYMLGLKANQIEIFDEDILPLSISWLILTDNKIKKLPDSIGNLTKLQKFPLAGNQLNSLPQSMQKCKNIELLRLSANNLSYIPNWLLELPKLSWLAFSGNDCSIQTQVDLEKISLDTLDIKEQLGEGASGLIYKAYSQNLQKDVALKLFKGAITSDGYAIDEMNTYMSIGNHSNLINVIAKVHEDEKLGLLLDLIPKTYKNLGFPPNFETCTRDTFPDEYIITSKSIYKIAKDILSVSIHLHEKNIMHGDLYAHNILINENNHCYLGDFGASSFYDNVNYEKIEVRAYGCLLDDLLNICTDKKNPYFGTLKTIVDECMQEDLTRRPFFKEINLQII
jgi:hypothetical protein